MLRTLISLVGLLLTCMLPTAWACDQYVKVDIKGELKKRPPVSGRSVVLLIAKGMQFDLSFVKPPPPQALDQLVGKTVSATGTLEQRRDPTGRAFFVCVVQGDLKAAEVPDQVENEYLIGHHGKPGDDVAVEKLIEGLMLKNIQYYKPGKYFRVRTTSETKANFLSTLRDNAAVRYVEAQQTYKIPEGEDSRPDSGKK